MRPRRVFLLTSVVAVTACGITAVGEFMEPPRPGTDAGPDAPFLLPDGAPFPAADAGDAGLADVDLQDACLSVCDGGCDAGTCVLDCADAGACVGAKVICPSGVPCAVRCGALSSCDQGVDCTQASRCDIACTGESSCAGGVACTGSACSVDCTGLGATCDKGVQCDAGECTIACVKDDCSGGPVACAGDDCTITCGVDAAPSEKNGCKSGVTCTAEGSCFVDCVGEGTCQGGVRVATDGGAHVNCLAKAACKGGVDVVARDASIVCGADDSCEGYVGCEAGACTFDCTVANDKNITACCVAPSCVADSGPCTSVTYQCQ